MSTWLTGSADAYKRWLHLSRLVQQLIDQDKRIRRESKKLTLEWHPKHLPAIRMHGPLSSA